MIRRPPRSPLFPSTPLFGSRSRRGGSGVGPGPGRAGAGSSWPGPVAKRSEEHTSELQSQSNLVCRLLLEKKNKVTTKGQRLRHDMCHGLLECHHHCYLGCTI